MHLDPLGDLRLFSAFCARRTNHPRDNYRCRPHVGIDRGQCVLRSQGRSHFFHIDPSGGDFDGDPAEFPRCDRSGKQHRADGCLRSGHAVVNYLVLPGLIMIGWWTGFPFWISFAICALGGILA